ncbi:MAG: iron-sulfur cluster repair di-iron protein [Flavobacteriales bacterium]|nr:iron-sulfur cluster repair di-iron protein [Flavobacteriales bacterium]MCB9364008.1 iron-sulfur cluster repair di-iron protein [Flavobacteriales bacterium]
MENIDSKTVAEIVTENIRTADVFKKNGIDFCCGGNVNVQDVCKKKGVDYSKVKEDILSIGKAPTGAQDFNTWDIDFLADYVVNTHHKYVKEANQLIIQYSERVAKVHGHHYTETIEINKLFHEIAAELNQHMEKEENILFPFIKEIGKAKKDGLPLTPPPFGTIQNPINMMEAEHTEAGDILSQIKELSNDFTPPEGACNTFRALYSKLEEYQNDLFQHIHLENNIMFPKAIQFEKELLG